MSTATAQFIPPRPQSRNSNRDSVIFRSAIARPSSRSSSRAPSPPPDPASPRPRRRASYDALASIASTGPASSIPLPVARALASSHESIPEGTPLHFPPSNPLSPSHNRPSTPTRTISRIPVSSVGHARTLAEDGSSRSRSISPLPAGNPGDLTLDLNDVSTASLQLPPTPSSNYNRRSLGGTGGTTKVLAELQAAALTARSSLENTKSQLRLSQRTVAQLTRQTEDLKDGRERLRLENESLNNVVARKERLLQEVLERARKAEAEVITLKTSLKNETQAAKKSVSTVNEAVAISQKSQREYSLLKDSITSMAQDWKTEVKDLKEEMRKQDDGWRKEVEEVGLKYRSLVKLVQATKTERARLDALKVESNAIDHQLQDQFQEDLKNLQLAIDQSSENSLNTDKTAENISQELARLRRLMRSAATLQQMQNEPPS